MHIMYAYTYAYDYIHTPIELTFEDVYQRKDAQTLLRAEDCLRLRQVDILKSRLASEWTTLNRQCTNHSE